MENIIIDSDPGIDDLFALVYGLREKRFNILGITTVGGNMDIDRVTKNAGKIVKLMGKDIRVYRGEEKPIKRPIFNRKRYPHGLDGLGGLACELEDGLVEDKPAVDFILDMARKYKDLKIICLGPLTNIGRAIEKDRELMEGIGEIVTMGGGFSRGNISQYSEFNYWFDPEAADIVYRSKIPLSMVSLNVTENFYFTSEDLLEIKAMDNDLARVLYRLGTYNMEENRKYIHDLATMLIGLNPKAYKGFYGRVKINLGDKRRGQTSLDSSENRGEVYIIEEIPCKIFKETFFKQVFSGEI